jgi:E3 ubiquitin-protein ligase RNF13
MVLKPCTTDWIALVERGGCSFITKVRYMQKSGASAVVIGDSKNSGWITMYAPGNKELLFWMFVIKKAKRTCVTGDTSDIKIQSVFLAKKEYTRILHLSKLLATTTTPLMVILNQDQNDLNSRFPFKW